MMSQTALPSEAASHPAPLNAIDRGNNGQQTHRYRHTTQAREQTQKGDGQRGSQTEGHGCRAGTRQAKHKTSVADVRIGPAHAPHHSAMRRWHPRVLLPDRCSQRANAPAHVRWRPLRSPHPPIQRQSTEVLRSCGCGHDAAPAPPATRGAPPRPLAPASPRYQQGAGLYVAGGVLADRWRWRSPGEQNDDAVSCPLAETTAAPHTTSARTRRLLPMST